MNLLTWNYQPEHLQRRSELLMCLHENLGNKFIDKIYVFTPKPFNFTNEKLEVIIRDKAPTFTDYFTFANTLNGICLIATPDMILDESIEAVKDIGEDFMALTRWNTDAEGNATPFESYVSQDVYAFTVPVKVPDAPFDFSMRGCDNRITYLMNELGYKIKNPQGQVKTVHFHLSEFRPSSVRRVGGPYLALKPTKTMNEYAELIHGWTL